MNNVRKRRNRIKSYVVTLNTLEGGNYLFRDYETVTGETPLDAVRHRFGKNMQRIYGDDIDNAQIAVTEGYYEKVYNILHLRLGGGTYYYIEK